MKPFLICLGLLSFGFVSTVDAQTTVSEIADDNANCFYTPSTRTVDCFSAPDDPSDTGYPLYEGMDEKPESPVNLIFDNNEIIVLDNPNQSYTLNVTGDWTFGNGLEVNVDNDASQLAINIGNNINPGNNANINANLTIGGSLNSGNNTELEGGLTVGGNLNLGNNSELKGIVTVEGDANIGNNVEITGDLSGNNINVGENSTITGNVEGSNINLSNNTTIDGNVNATSSVNNNGTITGYVNAPTINDNGSISGETCDQNNNIGGCAGTEEDGDDTPGPHTFVVPEGVTSITIEVWGAGGNGSPGSSGTIDEITGGGGGGGGAYSRRHLTVEPGQIFDYFVGGSDQTERDSWFRRENQPTFLLYAEGGNDASGDSAGAGGDADNGFGAYRYSGGSGDGGNGQGGGGGSSAGVSSSGTDGSDGGTAPVGGGDGGDGATATTSAEDGSPDGGGGGGGLICNDADDCTDSDPGSGANGRVRISWETDEPADPTETLHHINIDFNNQGLTCAPVEVIFEACANEDCDLKFQDEVSLTATNTGSGNGSGSWIDGASFSFTEQTTRIFARTETGTTTIGANSIDPEPEESSAVRCTDDDCDIEFVDTALLLTNADQSAASLSHYIAGDTLNDLFYLSAIRTDDETGACGPALSDETQDVLWAATTVDPNSPAPTNAKSLQLNDISINTDAGNTPTTVVPVDFNNDGRSDNAFKVQYDDVGELQLKASLELAVGSETQDLLLINDRSLSFRPASFAFSGMSCDGTAVSGGPDPEDLAMFCGAGETFSVTLEALNSLDEVTPNFGNESGGYDLTISRQLVAPTDGNNPALTGDTNISNQTFENGETTLELQWPEVGVITIDIALSEYLSWTGTGNDAITGESGNIGRFVPAYFTIGNNSDPSFLAGNISAAGNFTYQGQEFDLDQHNTLTYFELTPRATTNAALSNYQGDFNRFPSSRTDNNDLIDSLEKASGPGGNLTRVTTEAFVFNYIENGDTIRINVADDDLQTFRIERAVYSSTDLPPAGEDIDTFAATLAMTAAAFTDGDDVCVLSGGTCQGDNVSIEGHDLVYGRVRLYSAQGPDDRDLALPMTLEHWNGEAFEVFTRETGTQTVLDSGDFTVEGLSGFNASGLNPSPEEFDEGRSEVLLTAPNAPGRARIIGENIPEYLFYDWNDSGIETGPRAIASFGTYEGRPPVLFMLPMGR